MSWKKITLIIFSILIIGVATGIIIFFPHIFIKPIESSEEIILPNLNNLTIQSTTKYLQENIVLKNFTSYEEIVDYLLTSSIFGYEYYHPVPVYVTDLIELRKSIGELSQMSSFGDVSSKIDYSTTNVQVIGIDEPDIVKTDGKYIYVVNTYENTVKIIKAYPVESMEIISQINVSNGRIYSIFLDGNKLIILINNIYTRFSGIIYSAPGFNYKFKVLIYDISDKKKPKLISEIESKGIIFDARLTKQHLYLLAQHPVNIWTVCPVVTKINNKTVKIDCNEVKYFKGIYSSTYNLLKIYNIPINNPENTEIMSILAPTNTVLYMSNESIYLALYGNFFPKVVLDSIIYKLLPTVIENKKISSEIKNIWKSNKPSYVKINEILGILEVNNVNYSKLYDVNTTKKIEEIVNKFTDVSIILKITIENSKFRKTKIGIIPGKLLNQFSMDEFKGYLRVATTTGRWWREWGNNLYVLDKDLKIIGKIEGFERGERIYAVRFYGNKALVVTYRQVDPLLVINLSNPNEPKIEGSLKLPGYSTYLHPLDEKFKLIIGIGVENWNKIKVSLFNVSDPVNPKETDKWAPHFNNSDYYYISSEALSNHHAFLYVKKKNLVVIPLNYRIEKKVCDVYTIKKIGVPPACRWYYKSGVGVALIKINNDKLNVTVIKIKESTYWYYWYYYYYDYPVRFVYIDNILYIISPEKILAVNMTTEKVIKEISIGTWKDYYYYRPLPY